MQIRAANLPLLAPAIAWALDRREQKLVRRAVKRRAELGATFIGITGSSGKSTTSALLAHILGGAGKVKGQHGANIFKALARTLARMPANMDYVVAECGVGRLGHMAPMAGLLRPVIAIVTLVALEHKSAFGSIEAVAAEKAEMVAALAPDGVAILNGDDPFVSAMAAMC